LAAEMTMSSAAAEQINMDNKEYNSELVKVVLVLPGVSPSAIRQIVENK